MNERTYALSAAAAEFYETNFVIAGYFATGDPDRLAALCEEAGRRIDRLTTWMTATRLPSMDAFVEAELLPLAGHLKGEARRRIGADCRRSLDRFVTPGGEVAAPIEIQLVTGRG
ncbi:hypothetical protein M1L60_05155 [Actinoplanes sp. TRM 88003]|uniref:Uncharacterized protein n=1 Tax=Paractinoplanes aksuensis TaxID=2939490 RepID=A0ABT1DGL9_9ACTN|nr:hypothetical protein [Actinoplanes aksuensis]MCO8269979.1 hypothetical protein [Actinoplanes aksuensis]